MSDTSRLAALRNARGMSQSRLAEAVGCSRAQISSFEVGRREPKARLLHHILAVLQASDEERLAIQMVTEGSPVPEVTRNADPVGAP